MPNLPKWGRGGRKLVRQSWNKIQQQPDVAWIYISDVNSLLKCRHVTSISYFISIHLISQLFKLNSILDVLPCLPSALLIYQCPQWQLTVVLIVSLLGTNLSSCILAPALIHESVKLYFLKHTDTNHFYIVQSEYISLNFKATIISCK